MSVRRIIPCLDVKGGRVVKGIHFVNMKDIGDPAVSAGVYSREGADELVFLDITASVEERGTMLEAVKKTVEQISIPLTVGGGIRNVEDIRKLIEAGADKVSMNTAAAENPELIREASQEFGSERIIAAIDAKKSPETGWEVYIYGGQKAAERRVVEWAREVENLGAGAILLTSMDRDGTKEGYDLKLTRAVSEAVNIPVIASGGAGNLEHLYLALTEGKADAVLAASIFHYGEYSIREAKTYLRDRGIPVNLT